MFIAVLPSCLESSTEMKYKIQKQANGVAPVWREKVDTAY